MKIHSIAGYGYSEFIENTPAESPEAVKRYYYRFGEAGIGYTYLRYAAGDMVESIFFG